MSRKTDIFENVLTTAYNNDAFVGFIQELLNDIEMVAPTTYNKVYNNFSYYVDGYYHIGNYTGNDGNRIAVFSVALKKGDSVERARTMQRNFIKPLLENSMCAGALVAFYTADEPEKWRLSFIRLDYELSKGKVTENLTPARRYSYLVGKGEPCNTAKQRLFPIFNNDNDNPDVDELEEAFSVEKVTNEFFQLYCEKFHDLREYLESNEEFMQEAEYRHFTSEQFAKKLLGQILFLYFIQKKGWLGVEAIPVTMTEKEYKNAFFARGQKSREIVGNLYVQQVDGSYRIVVDKLKQLSDEDEELLAGIVKGKPWGTGKKDFMRWLFTGAEKNGKNYFDDYLEPLFYTGLNMNRGENGFYSALHRRIPFLNGGLFEQLDNYEWENNNFYIPNSIFSNVTEKGRNADGILDIFDRYNFTMNEDEPMEREVAIDPEMLGKVFENLLDIKDRKSKGAFYTPREIVHYMCQESLVHYIVNKLNLPYEEVKDFFAYGEIMKDMDCSKDTQEGNKQRIISDLVFENLYHIDKALENIKIADPAVGSGAFPLGMLNEIVKARMNITEYLVREIPLDKKFERLNYRKSRHPYKIKWDTIKNSIFAVDIEASAVDITKLRLWLSLVVEQEIDEENTSPHPLPNLDCNILCGNSLIDEFAGIKLFDDTLLLKTEHKALNTYEQMQLSIWEDQVKIMTEELFKEQDRLFGEDDADKKRAIKKHIDELTSNLIKAKLSKENNTSGLAKYEESLKNKTKPYFIWQLEFAKIFKENKGFDVVVGNPPYGAKFGKLEKEFLSSKYPTVPDFESADFFIDKALELLGKNAMLSYIVPNMFLSNLFAEKFRQNLLTDWSFSRIDNLSSIDVFDSAKVRNCIVFFKKGSSEFSCTMAKTTFQDGKISHIKQKKITSKELLKYIDNWLNILEQDEQQVSIIQNIKKNSVPLGELSEISQGLIPYDKYRGHSEETIKNRIWHADFKKDDTYKKELSGKDVNRYWVDWNGKTWISYGDWLAAPRRQEFFINERIIIREITNPRILAAYTTDEYYNTPSIINCINFHNIDIKYVLGIVNSKLMTFYHLNNSPKANKGLFPKILVNDVRKLPIVISSESQKNELVVLVEKLLELTINKGEVDAIKTLNNQIDKLVYNIYGLNNEEVSYVEKYLSEKGVY